MSCTTITRRWGDPESTRSGGSHFLFTALTIDAARQAHADMHRRYPDGDLPDKWLKREDGLRYVTALTEGDFVG